MIEQHLWSFECLLSQEGFEVKFDLFSPSATTKTSEHSVELSTTAEASRLFPHELVWCFSFYSSTFNIDTVVKYFYIRMKLCHFEDAAL